MNLKHLFRKALQRKFPVVKQRRCLPAISGHQQQLRRRWYSSSEEGILKSPYGEMEFPDLLLHDCMYEVVERNADKIAIECSMSGRKYTFKQLKILSNALAAAFQTKLNIQKGDVIAVFLPNLPEYPIVFLAGSQSGAVITTINSTYKHEEIARQLVMSDAKAVITVVLLLPLVQMAMKTMNKKLPLVLIKDKDNAVMPKGAIDFQEMADPKLAGSVKKVTISPDDILLLPFSSGTTGLPKGVQLTHKNIVSNIYQMDHAKGKLIKPSELGDTSLGILPMFHIYGMSCVTFSTLHQGNRLVSSPKFDPVHLIETIVKHQVNILYLVPPLILFLSSHPLVKPEHLKSVQLIVNGASPCGHKDLERLKKKAKDCLIGQGYGLTETSPVVMMFNKQHQEKYGGTGVPLISTEVKVMNVDTLKPQPANQVGELWVRGPQVMKGYLNNPEANRDIFTKDGWLKTGDLCLYDDEGCFFVVDRLKELIKVKGFQVAPAELEELLRSHPKVIDAAVIGIPDPQKGQVPKAFVVLKPGQKASEEEIKEFVKSKVADHKKLAGGVVFVDAIPKSASGKILKNELK